MKYEILSKGEEKPLADFYYGECFESYDRDEDSIHLMMVVGLPEHLWAEDSPKNIVFATDFNTGELSYFLDSDKAMPVQARVITDDVEWETITT